MRVKGFIRLHSSSGCQWGPQYLTVLVVAPKYDKGRDSTNAWPTALLHGELENIKDLCIRNACERVQKVAFMYRLPMGPAVPYSTCCFTKKLQGARLYENMTNCSPICETWQYHRYMYKECMWIVSQSCIHVQAANGARSALHYLLLHQIMTRGETLRKHD